MDSQNYVAPAPGGGFTVVVNGSPVGTYADQTTAEQTFNSYTGASGSGGSAPPPPTGGQLYQTPNGQKSLQDMITGLQGAGWNGNYGDPASVIAAYNATSAGGGAGVGGAATGSGSAAKLLDAIASGDRAKFDEAIREFNVTSGQADRAAGQTDRSQYSQLAQSLLQTAAQLRGPKDYYQFQQMTSGGKDLMSQLYGNTPRPDFSQPQGQITPMTIQDLMAKMGFGTAPGAPGTGAPTGAPGTPGTYTTINGPKTLEQMAAELKVAGWGGNPADAAAVAAAYASTTKGPVTPPAATAVAAPTAPIAGAPAPAAPATTTPLSGVQQALPPQPGVATPDPTANTGVFNPNQAVPLPYQIQPTVWDSLGPTGQALTLSIAGGQGWDPDEYLRQINQARPQGTAPTSSVTQFASPTGAFVGG